MSWTVLKNMRKIGMIIPDGCGGHVQMKPGEEKLVEQDVEYFKTIIRSGLTGLKAKPVVDESGMVAAGIGNTLKNAVVTNHRQIPALLSLGNGKGAIRLEPGESKEVVCRPASLKALQGISVRDVKDKPVQVPVAAAMSLGLPATPRPVPVEASPKSVAPPKPAPPPKSPVPEGMRKKVKKVSAGPPISTAPTSPVEEMHPLDKEANSLELPPTEEEFRSKAGLYTVLDLRAIGNFFGITGRNKAALIEEIAKRAYPAKG